MTYTEKELDQFLHGISLSLLSKKSAQHWRYDEETAKEIEWLEALERKVRADKADRKTENSSEIPNNCEHITEDGVTCAKYPACDDCLDNPLNKVKGSERLVKGSEQTDCLDRYDRKTEPTISKMEQVETMSCQECKHFHENAVMYLDQCDFCFKDCKYEPTTQTETQNSNLTFEKRTMRDCYNCKRYETEGECVECHYEPKDECAKEYEELGLKELKELINADRKTEQTISKMEQVEPQTDCGDFANRLAYERGVKHAWEVAQKVFDSTVTFYEAEDVAKQIDKDINVRCKTEPQTERLVDMEKTDERDRK